MKNTNVNPLTLISTFLLLCTGLAAQGYGEIRGIIKDTELNRVPYATIKILQGNQLVGGTQSNEEGHYHYKPLNPGTYELVVMQQEYLTQPVRNIYVNPNEATYVDVKLSVNTLGTVEVVAPPVDYTKTGVDKSMFSMESLSSEELMKLSSYSPGEVHKALESITSDVVMDNAGEVHFRGSRGDASGYFVDGVRTLKPVNVPGLSIENLTVFSGGVPASYGDVTSGVVVITTKSYFSGIREKNMRLTRMNELREQEKARKKAEEEEKARAKEIEEEKSREKEKAGQGQNQEAQGV